MKELAKVDSDLESQKEMLDMTQGDEEMARQIQPDVITIENNMRKVKQLKDQIDDLQATLGSSGMGISFFFFLWDIALLVMFLFDVVAIGITVVVAVASYEFFVSQMEEWPWKRQ